MSKKNMYKLGSIFIFNVLCHLTINYTHICLYSFHPSSCMCNNLLRKTWSHYPIPILILQMKNSVLRRWKHLNFSARHHFGHDDDRLIHFQRKEEWVEFHSQMVSPILETFVTTFFHFFVHSRKKRKTIVKGF